MGHITLLSFAKRRIRQTFYHGQCWSNKQIICLKSVTELYFVWLDKNFLVADMRKCADTRTLSAEVLMDCGSNNPDTLNFTLICHQKWKYYCVVSICWIYTFKTRNIWIFGCNLVTIAEIWNSQFAEILNTPNLRPRKDLNLSHVWHQ